MKHRKTFILVALFTVILTAYGFQTSPEYKILFEKAKFTMETKGDLNGAINLFNDIIKKYPKEREFAAKSQLYIGLCYEKLGVKEAQKAYQKVVNSYPEQTETVKLANEKLSILKKAETTAKNTEITIRRVLAGPDAIDIGGPSPDGRYLSYTDWETRDLSVHDLVTGQNRHITKNTTGNKPGDRYDYPDGSIFSSDGNQIAYCWWIDDKEFYGEIRTISLDGSGERVIYRSKENFPSRLDWSTDGKQILTKLNERPALIAVEDGSVQYLPIENPGMMCFSPDNGYIAYDASPSRESRQNDVYVYDLTTQRTSLLVQHPAEDRLLGWSPDGRYILFASDRRGSLDAWLIAVSGGQPRGEPMLVASNMSKRSGRVGFTRTGAFFFSGNAGGRDIFLTRFDNKTGKLLSPPVEATGSNLGSNWGPDFSRDGKSLAYFTDQNEIVIQSLETREKRLIIPSPDIRRPETREILRWAPDGRSLIVTGTDGQGKEGLLRIYTLTGEAALLFNSAYKLHPLIDLSPDGKKIFRFYPLSVWDSESGEEKLLTSRDMVSLAVSPDGGQLAFLGFGDKDKPGGLFVMPSTGGSPKLLVEAKDRRGVVTWSPDGSQLYYAVPSEVSGDGTPATLRSELWSVPSQGGEPKRLGLTVDGMMFSLRVHPDGQRIAYERSWSNPEIWVMESFLPKEKIEENNQLTLRKLDYTQLSTEFARLSPDGRYISYTDWNTGDLAIHDIVSGKDRLLTNKGSWALSSDNAGYSLFSPDGKQVAYTWRIWSKNQTELRIMNTDGSQPRIIYKGDDPWPVSWSPNGKFILVKLMNKDRTWRPAIISVADSSVRDLAFQISGAMCFSPDGKYIAYDTPQVKDSQQRDLYLYEITTKHTSPLVKHPADDGLLGWAPDGKHLLFTSDRSGTRDAWLVSVSGGQTQGESVLVRKNIGDIEGIGFTQSGDFYFHESIEGHNIYTARLDFNSGKLLSQPVEAAGSYLGSNWRPDFSRDGKFMAYISNRGSGKEQGNTIAVRSLETGREQILKPALEIGFGLRWASDGGSLFVNGLDKTKREGLFRVDSQTGEANLIVERHFIGVPGLEVSPDGRKIFYTAVLGSGIPSGESAYDVRHFVRDLQSGKEQELTRPGNTPLVPLALSPDGDQLAFIGAGDKAGSTGICVMPSSGGPSKQIVDLGTTAWASRVIAWSPDGRYLIYAVILPKTHDTNMGLTSWELWRVPAQGGEPQRLDLKVDGLLRHIRIHPDGQQIVYYTWHGDTETWVMENFLPK